MADSLATSKPRTIRGVLVEDVDDECIVYDTTCHKVHLLNCTLSWIWRECNGSRTVEEIVSDMQHETDCGNPYETVLTGLKQLGDAHLLLCEGAEFSVRVTAARSTKLLAAKGSVGAPVIHSIRAPANHRRNKPRRIEKPNGEFTALS